MATIYQKVPTDKGMILAPREGYFRKFNFSTWTELRVGMYYGMVAAVGDNTAFAVENVNLSSKADYIGFGLKNSDNNILPGFAGSTYWGIMPEPANTLSFVDTFPSVGNSSGTGRASFGSFNGTAQQGLTYPTYNMGPLLNIPTAAQVVAASGYAGFYALRIRIQNLGLPTQGFLIASSSVASVAGTDYSPAALRIQMNNAPYNGGLGVTYLPWVNGATPLPIPDAYFVRMPFFNNRIRISCIRAIRYA